METLDAQILPLTEQAATTAPELVLCRAGLTPDPFAADHPYDQLQMLPLGLPNSSGANGSFGFSMSRLPHISLKRLGRVLVRIGLRKLPVSYVACWAYRM